MKKPNRCYSALLSVALLCVPLVARAATPEVPLDDAAAYHAVDLLVAHGLVREVHYGQRPFSAGDVRRIVAEAQARLADREAPTAVRRALRRLQRAYGAPVTFRPVESAALQTVGLSRRRAVPRENGLGRVVADTAPLATNARGEKIPAGAQWTLSSRHQAQAGRFVAASVQPRVGVRTANNHAIADLQEALAIVGPDALELGVGRGRVVWGPGRDGGLLFSANGPPLDLVRVRTPQPFHLPWVLRYLGSLKSEIFFAYLGKSYDPAHTILSGYRVDVQPHPVATLGISHAMMMGGSGRSSPTPAGAVLEFLGIAGAIAPGQGADSNHLFNVDLHIKAPWRGLQWYAAFLLEDPDDDDLLVMFDDQAAWLTGFFLPRLADDGTWRARVEYTRAGAGLYRHAPYLDGWTWRGQLLGLPLGGDSQSWIATIDWLPSRWQLSSQVGVVQRRSDLYTNVTDARGNRISIAKTVDSPDEVGVHTAATWTVPFRRQWQASAGAGYEYLFNANFAGGQRQHHVFGTATLSYRFGAEGAR